MKLITEALISKILPIYIDLMGSFWCSEAWPTLRFVNTWNVMLRCGIYIWIQERILGYVNFLNVILAFHKNDSICVLTGYFFELRLHKKIFKILKSRDASYDSSLHTKMRNGALMHVVIMILKTCRGDKKEKVEVERVLEVGIFFTEEMCVASANSKS